MGETVTPIESGRARRPAKAYPSAPWTLSGNAHLHLFGLRRDRLPAVSRDFRPIVLGGHGFVVAGWVDTRAGSVPGYRELLAAIVGPLARAPHRDGHAHVGRQRRVAARWPRALGLPEGDGRVRRRDRPPGHGQCP